MTSSVDESSHSTPLDTVFFPRLYSPNVSPYLMITAVCGSTIVQTYFSGALTIALPTIGDQLGFGGADLIWPLTLFSLLNGSFLLLCGALADAYGRRTFFFIGTLWLMVMSLVITFVTSSTGFIALSALLGMGCAILAPASTGLLSMLPEGSLRNTSYAMLGAGQPLGFVLGLFAGGFLAKKWHVILYIMTGCSFVFAVLAIVSLPADVPNSATDQTTPGKWRRLAQFDWLGAFLSTVGLILLTFALADAGSSSKGWKSPFVPAMLPLAVLCLLSFGLWEIRLERRLVARRSKLQPLLPPSIWKVPTFTPLLSMVFFAWANFNTVTYFGTLYIQEVQKLSPVQAAVRFLPMVVSGIAYNLFTGVTVARVHGLILIVLGCVGAAVACIFYGIMGVSTLYWSSLFITFILTTATDIIFPVAQMHACNCVGPKRAALAGGLFNTTTRLSSSLGLAITATISTAVTKQYAKVHGEATTAAASEYSPQALLKGYQAAVWFCFALAIVALVVALVWLRGIGIVGFQTHKSTGGTAPAKTDAAQGATDEESHADLTAAETAASGSQSRIGDVKKRFDDGDHHHHHHQGHGHVDAATVLQIQAATGATSAPLAQGSTSATSAMADPQSDSESTRGLRSGAATPGRCTPAGSVAPTRSASRSGSEAYELGQVHEGRFASSSK